MARYETIEIWQWNCRGYRKKGQLLQYINTQLTPPDIIALQEKGKTTPTLKGYTCYEKERTAILISKSLTAIAHDSIADTDIDHGIVEIIPKKKRKDSSVFVINLYSPPSQKEADFRKLLQERAN